MLPVKRSHRDPAQREPVSELARRGRELLRSLERVEAELGAVMLAELAGPHAST